MEGEDERRTISMPIRRGRSSGYDVLQLAIPESGHSTCSSRLDGGQLELPLSLRIETLVGLPRSFSPFSVLFSPPFPLASSPTGSMVANPTPLKPIIGASLSPCLALIYPSMVSITSSDTTFPIYEGLVTDLPVFCDLRLQASRILHLPRPPRSRLVFAAVLVLLLAVC